jgi:hypothetical protein
MSDVDLIVNMGNLEKSTSIALSYISMDYKIVKLEVKSFESILNSWIYSHDVARTYASRIFLHSSQRESLLEQEPLFKLFFPNNKLLLSQEYKQLLQLLSREMDEQEIKTRFPEHYYQLCVLLTELDLPNTSTNLPSIISSRIVIHKFSYSKIYKDAFRAIESLLEIQSLLIKRTKIILEDINTLMVEIRWLLALLKKLIVAWIRLQVVAYQIHNKISRSPTPQKKEPPTGGVKIGGKQHDIFRHVTEVLYLKPIFILNQAAVP